MGGESLNIVLVEYINRNPVSYTHLDVYKRQLLHCGFLPILVL